MERIDKATVLKTSDLLPMKAGHTISKAISDDFILFSLAADTDISEESYLEDKSYFVLQGDVTIAGHELGDKDLVVIPRGQLLGLETKGGAYILEGTWAGEKDLKVEKDKVINLKDYVDYVEGGISNVDLAKRPGMKFGLLAFDKGQGLTPHSAPGDALVMVLEGRAKLGLPDVSAEVGEGDQFVLPANIPHAVDALTPFKMALLMVSDKE